MCTYSEKLSSSGEREQTNSPKVLFVFAAGISNCIRRIYDRNTLLGFFSD